VATAARVNAVSDEHSNSLIVTASDSQMAIIAKLIDEVDTDVQDLTDIRVFHLKYADPVETADLLTSLFPDPTKQDTGRGGGFSFGGGGPPGFPGISRTTSGRTTSGGSGASSDRQKKMGKVVAVADARTQSIVVSAAKEMMPQISEMILQLDSDPAKKQKVHVLNLENANVAEVETVLRSLFESQNSRSTQSQNRQTDILGNRANTSSQSSPSSASPLNLGGSGGGQGGGGNFR
jgi:type II secretory pathway component GspD/PulD (secretin)